MTKDTEQTKEIKQKTKSGFVLKGHHVLMGMIAFFGVIITVNFIFVRHAIISFPGEQQKKSYMQGLHYNDVLADREIQRSRGWKIELLNTPNKSGAPARVSISLVDNQGKPIPAMDVNGVLRRPTTDVNEVILNFQGTAPGQYSADEVSLAEGAWDLSLVVRQADEILYSASTRLMVQSHE